MWDAVLYGVLNGASRARHAIKLQHLRAIISARPGWLGSAFGEDIFEKKKG